MSDYGPLGTGVTPMIFELEEGSAVNEVPPYAVLALVKYAGSATTSVHTCRRPTADDVASPSAIYVVNGPTKVAQGGRGACFLLRHQPGWAMVDPALDVGQLDGEQYQLSLGPIKDEFFLSKDGSGFTFCGLRDDGGTLYEGRALVIESTGAKASKWFRITTENCCLDAYSIDVGTLSDDDNRPYVEARPCDKYTGEFVEDVPEGEEPEDVVKLYPAKSLRGFVSYGLRVECVPTANPDGWLIVAGGVEEITAVAVDTDSATLYEETDGEVQVEFTDLFEDGVSEGQTVCLTWELDGVARSRLRLSDFGCPPEPE